jgi:UDP:flavonoid glycosyltransferase YjiC (YdhE family)
MARYLLAVSPLDGHVMPLARIGADLADRGHHVSLLTAPAYHDLARSHRMQTVTLPSDGHPSRRPRRRDSLLPASISRWSCGRAEMRDVFIAPMASQYMTLRTALHTTAFDAVLCDFGFTGALPLLLTARRRPPVLVCGVGPLTLSSADTPPFGTGWRPRPGTDYTGMNRVVHGVLFADIRARLDRALRRAGSAPSPVFLTDWPLLADRILQFTVPQLEYPRRDLPPSITFTGPVFAPDLPGKADVPESLSLTDESTTVVHVTQGTWDNHDLSQLVQPTLDALAGRDDVLVIATTGRRGRTELPGAVPSNAYVADYLPYSGLLPHVDLVITNGGYGGVQHALAHGIPLIVAGEDADKPEVAARVEFAGAGINLGTARPTPFAITAAVERLRNETGFRATAQAISRELNATRPLDTIADILTTLPPVGALGCVSTPVG